MSTIAFDQFALTRIADFSRTLSRLHQVSRRRLVDDDEIDREFNAVCLSMWGYTTDDFSDDLFSAADHAFLDSLDEAHARIFAAERGYDLVDDSGMLTDWWGYCWMILAEKRGLLTPENRAAARAAIEENDSLERLIDRDEFASARFARATAAFSTDVTDSAAGDTGASAAMSAATGATFISPKRARTSAVSPG